MLWGSIPALGSGCGYGSRTGGGRSFSKAQYMERFIGQRFTGVITGGISASLELPIPPKRLIRMASLDDDYYVTTRRCFGLPASEPRKILCNRRRNGY